MINDTFATDISEIRTRSLLSQNRSGLKETDHSKLEKTAQEFESLFVYEMLKEMNKNISFQNKDNPEEDDVLIKKNQIEVVFNDFLTYERSKMMVESQGLTLGLAKSFQEQYGNYK